jgi:predicted dehydrogenase
MTEKIRWGILGCGKIANKFAADLPFTGNSTLVAVASRDAQRAADFSIVHKVPQVFTSYEALASSNDVDAIYVATPHGFHYEHVMLCLRHRKAVLCEKAFALNSKQAKAMIDFARKEKVFLMEAFWTRFLPQYQQAMDLIRSGGIGDVRMLHADFGFRAPAPAPQRLFDPRLGGGSLLDIGIYPVFLALAVLGRPVTIQASMTPFSTGVDEQCSMVLTFEGGAQALLSSTFATETPVEAMIAGTKGRIHLRNRFHNAMAVLEVAMGKEAPRPVDVIREQGNGYQFEARHVAECLQRGLTESSVMTHADTLLLMETLDRIRQACGIHYEVDS